MSLIQFVWTLLITSSSLGNLGLSTSAFMSLSINNLSLLAFYRYHELFRAFFLTFSAVPITIWSLWEQLHQMCSVYFCIESYSALPHFQLLRKATKPSLVPCDGMELVVLQGQIFCWLVVALHCIHTQILARWLFSCLADMTPILNIHGAEILL